MLQEITELSFNKTRDLSLVGFLTWSLREVTLVLHR